MIKFSGFKTVNLINSTIRSADNLYIDNFTEDCTVLIANTILDVPHVTTSNLSYRKSVNVTFDQVTLSTTIANLTAIQSGYETVYYTYDSTTLQESWSSTISGVNPLSATDINYLGTNFDDITLSGDSTYSYAYEEWYSGIRDGIGALYFDAPNAVLSASTFEGNIPFSLTIGLSATSANSANGIINYYLGNGQTSATNALQIAPVYANIGVYHPYASIQSHNGWHSPLTNSLTISATDPLFTINWDVFYESTSATTNSSYAYDNLFLSASAVVTSGSIQSYTIDLGDGQTFTLTEEPIYKEFQYDTPGVYTLSLSVLNPANQEFFDSFSFTVTGYTSATYYVNINENYDSTTVHSGAVGDPLTWDEMVVYINSTANKYSIFKLKGERNLTPGLYDDLPYTPLAPDVTKSFTIDAWDSLNYGPWILSIEDYVQSDQNNVIDFRGCTLKNGIIYNKPFTESSVDYGGSLLVTSLYDMYIVMQGTKSFIKFYKDDDNLVNLYGCTIYSENGYADAGETYRFNCYDSVMNSLLNYDYINFQNASCYFYNDTFTNTAANIVGQFQVIATSGCQYSWTAPTDYPFKKDCTCYEQSLDWLMIHKRKLDPFANIATPPNPGVGFWTYPGYPTGLFGYSRKLYAR